MAEIAQIINMIRIQFIPYVIEIKDIDMLIDVYIKISVHKEIFICVINKVIEAYFYMNLEKVDKNDNKNQFKGVFKQCEEFKKVVCKYLDISELCL